MRSIAKIHLGIKNYSEAKKWKKKADAFEN